MSSTDTLFIGKRDSTINANEARSSCDLTRMDRVVAEMTAENLGLKKRFGDGTLRTTCMLRTVTFCIFVYENSALGVVLIMPARSQ